MKDIVIGIAAITALMATSAAASAQSTESRSTEDILQRLQAIEANNAALAKENAALRERIKLSEENAELRDRNSKLKGANQTAAAQQSPISAVRRSDPKIALYDKVSSPTLVNAPSPLPAPLYNWTGLYVGGNIGYGWGNANTDIAGSGTGSTFVGVVPGFTGFPGTVAFADSNSARLSGVIGGGQIGFNYQFSPHWVFGLETDFQASGQRGSSSFVDSFSTSFCAAAALATPPSCVGTQLFNGTAATAYEAKIDWFGTVRGRLGLLIDDQLLVYGTGGLVYGRVQLSGTTIANGAVFNGITSFPAAPAGTTFGVSRTNVGFSAGAGMEGRYWLPPNWTWKLEYLYIDLGSLDGVTNFPPIQPSGFASPMTGSISTHTHFTDNIVRVGLNYQSH